MSRNTKRFAALLGMVFGFTGIHFAFWWYSLTSTTIGLQFPLSLPIALPVMSIFAFANWPDGAFVALGIAHSAIWGIGLSLFVLWLDASRTRAAEARRLEEHQRLRRAWSRAGGILDALRSNQPKWPP